MDTLEQFIVKHTPLVRKIIYKSSFYRIFDADDISELTYIGLWKAYRFFNPEKANIQTFITKIINNSIISLAKKKKRQKRAYRYIENQDDFSYNENNSCEENFTDEELSIVKPIIEGNSILESSKLIGISRGKYTKKLQKIGRKLKLRNR